MDQGDREIIYIETDKFITQKYCERLSWSSRNRLEG